MNPGRASSIFNVIFNWLSLKQGTGNRGTGNGERGTGNGNWERGMGNAGIGQSQFNKVDLG